MAQRQPHSSYWLLFLPLDILECGLGICCLHSKEPTNPLPDLQRPYPACQPIQAVAIIPLIGPSLTTISSQQSSCKTTGPGFRWHLQPSWESHGLGHLQNLHPALASFLSALLQVVPQER